MKNLFLLFILFLPALAFGEIKITQLPTGSAAATASTDVFPYVDVTSSITKKMTLWDLVNLPPFQAFVAQSLLLGNASSTAIPFTLIQQGGAGSIKFKNASSSGKYNWLIACQQNVDQGCEVTASTAADGSTFSNPLLAITQSGLSVFRKDQNNITTVQIRNDTNGASSESLLKLSSSTDDLNVFALSAASGTNASGMTSNSGFTQGFILTQLGANPITFKTNNTTALAISGTQAVSIGTGTSTQHTLNTLTAAASNCGSLSGAAGCVQMTINGTTHYVPYW